MRSKPNPKRRFTPPSISRLEDIVSKEHIEELRDVRDRLMNDPEFMAMFPVVARR